MPIHNVKKSGIRLEGKNNTLGCGLIKNLAKHNLEFIAFLVVY